jgi:hypothetical protein
MYIPKKYGQSKVDPCPFCRMDSTTKNKQQVPVCQKHKENILRNLTCFCGDYLELKDGKFGVYFNCTNCGNINIKKALEMNPDLGKEPKTEEKVAEKAESKTKATKKTENKKEITITSDEAEVFYT